MSTFVRFTSQDKIQYDSAASDILGKDHWRVLEKFRYYVGKEDSDTFIDVPAGYLTDGASIPRIFHSVICPWGRHGQAAIVHDYLCEYLTLTKRVTINDKVYHIPTKITRKECDFIFLEAMRVLEVKPIRRKIMHVAVSSYRVLGRVSEPSLNIHKLKLERDWRAERNIPEPN